MLQMVKDKVLLKLKERQSVIHGVALPWTHVEDPAQGYVVDRGEEVDDLDPGDEVVFAKFAGEKLEIDGVLHIVLRYDQILAKVERIAS